MNLAKQHLDIGLFSTKRDEQLAFWQQRVGLPYDHMGKVGGGVQQHRHHMNGSILKFITRTRPRIWHEVVYYIQNGDLFDEGYLQRPTYKHWPAIDRHKVKANSKGTDYDDRALQLHLFKANFQDKLVKAVRHLKDEVKRKNCLIFTRYVPEAQYLASKIDVSPAVWMNPVERSWVPMPVHQAYGGPPLPALQAEPIVLDAASG